MTGIQALWKLQSLGFIVDRIERRGNLSLKVTGIGVPPADLVAAMRADRDVVLEHLAEQNRVADRHEHVARGFLRAMGYRS